MTRVTRAAMIVASVIAASVIAASARAAPAQGADGNPEALVREAFAALNAKGGRTDTETCAIAAPLFDQAFVASRDAELRTPGYSADQALVYPRLQQGYCKVATGDPTAAVALFAAVVRTGDSAPSLNHYAALARACLANAYALGRGTSADRERALALYALSEGSVCPVGDVDAADQAADIVRTFHPGSLAQRDSLVYHFLRLGTAKDWWIATQLSLAQFSGIGAHDIVLMKEGLEAGGSSPQDDEARAALNLKLGQILMDRGARSAALGYLQAVGTAAAQKLIAELLNAQQYVLTVSPEAKAAMADAH